MPSESDDDWQQIERLCSLVAAGRVEVATSVLTNTFSGPCQKAATHVVIGRLFERAAQHDCALQSYRVALACEPSFAPAALSIARLLTSLGKHVQATDVYISILERYPNNTLALRELCWLSGTTADYRTVLSLVDRLETCGQDVVKELAQVVLGSMHICDWSRRTELEQRLIKRITLESPCIIDPYSLLASVDDPSCHAKVARCFAAAITSHISQLPRPPHRKIDRSKTERLRVAYLCGDFCNHPTSMLLAGVIQAHDSERFQITIYDYSPDDNSAARSRVIGACERLVLVKELGPTEVAAMIADDQTDILVDLNGYTNGARPEIMALRPAPVQVNFLGYVGTQGAPWIDYVIADKHVLPLSEQKCWHEQIVHLPHSYYPNDRTRPIPKQQCPLQREKHGLPPSAFVFACFNSCYKISPEIFAIWMKILRACDSSVLWLYESNPLAKNNLFLEATRAGVSCERIVFSPPMPFEEHIDRHAYADLFLDTAPYGAHTTGADALWAGVPVLTIAGRAFASRVGSSLLHAVGLPDLVASDREEYFSLAVHFARNPAAIIPLREHLIRMRYESPLFDAGCFAASLEKVFLCIAERNQLGLAPAQITLS